MSDIHCGCGFDQVVLDPEGDWCVYDHDGGFACVADFCPRCGVKLEHLTDEEKLAVGGILAMTRAIYWARFKVLTELRARILKEHGFE